MAAWMHNRYWCANVAGRCLHALADTPFDERQFRAWHGRCGGDEGADGGCGQPLVAGEAHDLRRRWLAGAVLAAGALSLGGWTLRELLLPAPIERVAFASAETRTDDTRGTLSIEVVRDAEIERRIVVRCRTIDGSAKAGEDFDPVTDRLVFEPGERRKELALTLLPDSTRQKAERHFTLVLPDVLGAPRHVIVIEPRAVDRSAQRQADQGVMMASRTAADIASLVVKHDVLDRLMAASRDDAAAFDAYRRQLADVDGNLTRAREGYAQALRDLQTFQPTLVLESMDRLGTDLARRSFTQQSRAMAVMKQQYAELLRGGGMDLDRWVIDLGKTVPRVTPTGPATVATRPPPSI